MYLFSRIKVAMFGAFAPYMKFPKPFSFVGPDASLSMCRELLGSGVQRVMLVTDAALFKLGIANPMIELLQSHGVTVEVFDEIEPDPGFDVVLRGIERLAKCRAQALLVVGGGSSIDGAKAMALSYANDCHPSDLIGIWLYSKPRKPGLPLYAVPTTAGTGSEVTIGAVISDPQKQIKCTLIDPKMVPEMLALDPRLMTGLPPFITAPTGMDALTHSIEAYLSTTACAESDAMALKACASIFKHLPIAYADGQNLEARERMAVASCMAGLAITRAGVGYIHGIAHQLGALYHVPHGLANAIVMPYVLDFSKTDCSNRMADLARVAGIGPAGASDSELADALIERIRQLNASLQIPLTVKELKPADFSRIITAAFAETHGTYGVPKYMTRTEMTAILESLLPV